MTLPATYAPGGAGTASAVVKESQTATAEAAAGYSMNNFTMAPGAAPAAAGGRATGGPEVSV